MKFRRLGELLATLRGRELEFRYPWRHASLEFLSEEVVFSEILASHLEALDANFPRVLNVSAFFLANG